MGFTREFILGLAGSGSVGPFVETPGTAGGKCERRFPWSPPLDGGVGAGSG